MYLYFIRKELSLNQKNKGAAIETPLFVVQGCLEMNNIIKFSYLENFHTWTLGGC